MADEATKPTPNRRPRIVVGIDGSPGADAALRWAYDEAQLRDDDLEVVVAWDFIAKWAVGFNPEWPEDSDHLAADTTTVGEKAVNQLLGGASRPSWLTVHASTGIPRLRAHRAGPTGRPAGRRSTWARGARQVAPGVCERHRASTTRRARSRSSLPGPTWWPTPTQPDARSVPRPSEARVGDQQRVRALVHDAARDPTQRARQQPPTSLGRQHGRRFVQGVLERPEDATRRIAAHDLGDLDRATIERERIDDLGGEQPAGRSPFAPERRVGTRHARATAARGPAAASPRTLRRAPPRPRATSRPSRPRSASGRPAPGHRARQHHRLVEGRAGSHQRRCRARQRPDLTSRGSP